MNETTRVFALVGDAALRRQLQQQWRGDRTTLCGMHSEGGDSIVEELARVRPDVLLVDADVDGMRPLVQAAASRLRVPVLALVRGQQSGLAALRPLEWGALGVVPREAETQAELVTRLELGVAELHDAQVVDLLESHFPLSGAFPDASVFDLRRSLQALEPADKLVVIGAGAGGPMALRRILAALKTASVSPIVVAQRLAAPLGSAFVQWLEHHTGATVVRATSGTLEPGRVYVVTSGCEATIERHNGAAALTVTASSADTTPSFDVLFESTAATYGSRGVAVLLSGRGSDGTQGLVALRRAGGLTVVQDRVSSILFDAPGQARDGGGAIECLPINEIAERIQMLMRPEPAGRA
jgi:two-component system chemotaxis response regulator CheB